MRNFLLSILFGISISECAFCDLQLPTSLVDTDEQKIVRDVGSGLSPHLMGQIYPLGGYDGVELGGYRDFISTGDIGSYGTHATSQSTTSVNSFVIGKGFFYDLDFYLTFSPLGETEAIQNVGGAVKWTFYQGISVPAFMGLQVGTHSANVQNEINITGQNAILYSGFHFMPLHFYGGFGLYRAQGKFVAALNYSGQESNVSVAQEVFLAGLSYNYRKVLVELNILDSLSTTYQLGVYFKL